MPAILSLALLQCWLQLFNQLRAIWSGNEQYSYGWFVPILAAALLWLRWRDRAAAPGLEAAGLRPWMAALAAALLFVLLPFRLLEEPNPGWFVLLWIHALVLLALSLGALFCWGGGPAVRWYWFPFFFLLTSVVWPSKVESFVTRVLMGGVARATVEVVGLFDIPAIQHGSVLEIGSGTLGVDEACSGIRSLQTSIMLALLLGELCQLRPRNRILLLPSAILVALVANVGRTSLLCWSAAKQGLKRMEALHGPAGIAVVVMVMGVLLLLAWLGRGRPEETRNKATRGQPPESTDQPPVPSAPRGHFAARPISAGFLGVCCLWVPLTEGLNWTWYHWPGRGLSAATPWSIQWPTNEMGFARMRLPDRTVSILRCSTNTTASWTDAQGNAWTVILVGWPAERAFSAYVGGHNPEGCMGGIGTTFLRKVGPVATTGADFSMHFTHRLFTQERGLLHVFQGTWEPYVPPMGQRLFGDASLRARVRNVLERRVVRGGIMLEISVAGPASVEDAARLLQELMRQLVVEGPPLRAGRN